MFKRTFYLVVWFLTQPNPSLLPTLLLTAHCLPAWADSVNVPVAASLSVVPSSLPLIEVPEEIAPDMTELGVQIDPIDSPHPIPWNWVLAAHAEISAYGGSGIRYYRSPSLISPDGQYAAYSRIQMQADSELYRSRVTSVMFVENLRTGDLRTIKASSPLADNPLVSNQEADMGGTFGIMIPISWSKLGDRILARQFEGVFNTSDASDYAVIWDRQQNRALTIAPDQIQYSSAVLLGWSEIHPDRVLFRTDEMGDEHWSMWAVDLNGQTAVATEDNPSIYGQVVNQVWAGPQSRL